MLGFTLFSSKCSVQNVSHLLIDLEAFLIRHSFQSKHSTSRDEDVRRCAENG